MTNVRLWPLSYLHLLTSLKAGGSPDRIGGKWQLRRIASVVVNGNTEQVESLYQRDSNKGIILSTPLQVTFRQGSDNTLTIGGLSNGIDCEYHQSLKLTRLN